MQLLYSECTGEKKDKTKHWHNNLHLLQCVAEWISNNTTLIFNSNNNINIQDIKVSFVQSQDNTDAEDNIVDVYILFECIGTREPQSVCQLPLCLGKNLMLR